ncbi:PREDICTED: MYCBP-associated protein-like [Eufriesea mexicana]|uniref:MYCBP-associated protein-like n=1 Tax=Eufriesea mexicana TaxID=516756 RepID=UPI00083BD152|nr:PREDICTED: MYCBP-associated protein-like [Eufriesea mexicana]
MKLGLNDWTSIPLPSKQPLPLYQVQVIRERTKSHDTHAPNNSSRYMDYARKIGKSDEPKKWVRQFTTTVSVRDGLVHPSAYHPKDRRLENWQRWLDIRKAQYRRIESMTGRQPADQVMNSCEKVRPLVEMRNLIDYASVPVPVLPDKYRGGPEFWRTPQKLPNRGDPCLPDISFTPSKKELNVIPELTYVGLPDLIEKEKHLVGLRSKEPLWKRSGYLTSRRQELRKEITTLVAKEPDMEDLVIKNYVPPKREVQPRIPPITISDADEEIGEEEGGEGKIKYKSCCECYPEQSIVLKIQDLEIVWQRPASRNVEAKSDPIVWSLVFSGKVNERAEKEIVFENKGNRVIIYQWRQTTFPSQVTPVSRRISPFFFNKTKGVILPGQISKLKIWYRPRNPHMSTEFWKLVTSPVLCSSPLVFRFWGCAAPSTAQTGKPNQEQMVDEYLNRCIRNTAIRQIIDDIIERFSTVKHPNPPYSSLFLEPDLFIAKNPMCHYSPNILIELHKLYFTVTNQTERRWSMLLDEIRDGLLKIKDSEKRNNLFSRFVELYKESLKPTWYRAVQYDKYEVVYNLLCAFFNRFEIENEFAMKAYFVKEYEDTPGMASEMSYTMLGDPSQVSIRSNSSRNRQTKSGNTHLQRNLSHVVSESSIHPKNVRLYGEIFFIRIYKLLGETLVGIFGSIESFNNLNEPHG